MPLFNTTRLPIDKPKGDDARWYVEEITAFQRGSASWSIHN